MLKVYLVQIDSAKGSKSEHLARAKKMILDANPAKGSLILLPEMFATGYIPTNLEAAAEDFSSSIAGETARMLSEVVSATGCTIMGAGISNAGNKFYNHVSIYEPGNTQEVASYDKMNLFFPEKENFKAGEKINLFNIKENAGRFPIRSGMTNNAGLTSNTEMTNNARLTSNAGITNNAGKASNAETIECSWKVASFICYDLRFPELFREATKQGANLITVQAAWPAKRNAHWETLLKARAIENQVYIAAVNAVSTNPTTKIQLAGNSLILSPNGDVIAEGSSNEEVVLTAELELQAENDLRKSFPVLEGIIRA